MTVSDRHWSMTVSRGHRHWPMTVSRSIFNDGKRLFENGGSLYRDKIKSVKTLFFDTNDTVLRGKCFACAILVSNRKI